MVVTCDAAWVSPYVEPHWYARLLSARHERRGYRAAAGERAAQMLGALQPLIEQARERGGDEAHAGRPACAEIVQHPVDLESLVDDRRRAADCSAHQDGHTAHMSQCQCAQPALVLPNAQRHAGAQGTPQQVSIGELHRPRRSGRARGVDHDRDRVEVVAGSDRERARHGPLPQRLAHHHAGAVEDALLLARSQAQVDWHRDRAEQQARVQRLSEAQPGGQGDGDAIPRTGTPREQLARPEARGRMQLGVGPVPGGGLKRHALRGRAAAARGSHASTSMAHRLAFAP